MCFGNLNLLVTQQQLNKVIPIMWWLITMAVIEVPKLHCQVKEPFKGTVHTGFMDGNVGWLVGWSILKCVNKC